MYLYVFACNKQFLDIENVSSNVENFEDNIIATAFHFVCIQRKTKISIYIVDIIETISLLQWYSATH